MATPAGDNLWSPETDNWFFFGFFLLGVVCILLLKSWFYNQWLPTAVPICFMLGYAAFMWDSNESQPRPGSRGDNLYYLGFLYTLTSVAHSLYQFSANQVDAEGIVTNFGIAIGATIAGMALRVVFARHGTDDATQIEANVRLDLAHAARNLRSELDFVVQEFVDFREQARANLKQIFDDATASISATVGHTHVVQEVAETFEKDMREVTGALRHQARSLGEGAADLRSFEQAVTELQKRVNKTTESLAVNADAMETGASAVRKSLETQAERIGGDFVNKLRDQAAAAAATELGTVVADCSALLAQLKEADTRRDAVLVANERAVVGLGEALGRGAELSQASADAAGVSRDVVAELRVAGERVVRLSANMESLASQLAEAHAESARYRESIQATSKSIERVAAVVAAQSGKQLRSVQPSGARHRWRQLLRRIS